MFMSLQRRLPDPAGRADRQTWFFRECTRPTRIAIATPDQEEVETRDSEGVRGPQSAIDGGRQRIEKRTLQPSDRDAMLAAVPSLRAFAISLSGTADRADDLVQETFLRATANISSFQSGTNMLAWLFTILRNHFLSECRKRRREVEDADGRYMESLTSSPAQYGSLEFKELFTALAKLPLVQREVLLLVGASGFSYDEAAAICCTPVGTVKSRVNRARTMLAELLGIDRKTGPTAEVTTNLIRGHPHNEKPAASGRTSHREGGRLG
jgi:RNA polymerase sigma-70 factor, ECF subfamily